MVATIPRTFALAGRCKRVDAADGLNRRQLRVRCSSAWAVVSCCSSPALNVATCSSAARSRGSATRRSRVARASRHRLFRCSDRERSAGARRCGLGFTAQHLVCPRRAAVITTSLPGVSDFSLDVRVVTFTLALSIATALFFGLVPMIAGLKRELIDVLREGARAAGGRGQHRLQAGLVVTSVAFAFVLLVASGLLIRSFNNLMNAESGIHALNVLSVEVSLPHAGYNQAPRVLVLSDRPRAAFTSMCHSGFVRPICRWRRR